MIIDSAYELYAETAVDKREVIETTFYYILVLVAFTFDVAWVQDKLIRGFLTTYLVFFTIYGPFFLQTFLRTIRHVFPRLDNLDRHQIDDSSVKMFKEAFSRDVRIHFLGVWYAIYRTTWDPDGLT